MSILTAFIKLSIFNFLFTRKTSLDKSLNDLNHPLYTKYSHHRTINHFLPRSIKPRIITYQNKENFH